MQICADGMSQEVLDILTSGEEPRASVLACPGVCTAEQQMACWGMDAWMVGDSMQSFKNSKGHIKISTLYTGLQATDFTYEFFGKNHVGAANAGQSHRWLLQTWTPGLGAKARDITLTLQKGIS